jgi:DNA-binding winged helix-turn-helix (wHTH) protein
MLVRFGNCELDSERRELRRGATLVHVQPQVFDLLVYLITHRDRVVSRDEMVEAVWEGRSVSVESVGIANGLARDLSIPCKRKIGAV